MDRRDLLKAAVVTPVAAMSLGGSPTLTDDKKVAPMGQPKVITVPANAGVGTNPPVQIPLGSGATVTIVNLNAVLGLTLCQDQTFTPGVTWPLNPGVVAPITGLSNIWAKNTGGGPVNLLVLEGIVPFTFGQQNPAPKFLQRAIGSLLTAPIAGTGQLLVTAPGVGKTLVIWNSVITTGALAVAIGGQLLGWLGTGTVESSSIAFNIATVANPSASGAEPMIEQSVQTHNGLRLNDNEAISIFGLSSGLLTNPVNITASVFYTIENTYG